MSDDVIDLTKYLDRDGGGEEGPGSIFALWGAEGERSRFALPLWRSIYLANGDRGAIVWCEPSNPTSLRPFVVLDLANDPPRTTFPATMVGVREGDEPPALRDDAESGLSVLLGVREGRRWYMVVDGGGDARSAPVPRRDREDILFLAGECAGLLFLRDFADEA